MALPARDPFSVYLVGHATMLRRRQAAPAAAERAHALELLADVVRDLAEDDERLLMLATLAVRQGHFTPGPAADHALTQFAGTSRDVCDTFLTTLVHIALDDALGQARHHGVLPPRRPR
jgi:hypothetical protein